MNESLKEELQKEDLTHARLSGCGGSSNDLLTGFLVRLNMKKNLDVIVHNENFETYKKALKSLANVSDDGSDKEWLKNFFSKEQVKIGESLEYIRSQISNRQRTTFIKSVELTLETNNLRCEKYKNPELPF